MNYFDNVTFTSNQRALFHVVLKFVTLPHCQFQLSVFLDTQCEERHTLLPKFSWNNFLTMLGNR